MAVSGNDKSYLGVEISTQQIKVIAVDDMLRVIYEDGVKFDSELPEFKTKGGVHIHDDRVTVTAPVLMWIKAVDVALERMKRRKFDFTKVAAVSGNGQQHGSVYWKTGSRTKLTSLNSSATFYDQLKDCFSIEESPVWMDDSTGAECHQLESALGGAMEVSSITGSKAYHRFTGNQIAKIFKTQRTAYNNTERISLVSSLGASLFIGDYAPIDFSDGSGMNLLDLREKSWSERCVKAFQIDDLPEKLGATVAADQCIGTISNYLIDRYDFSPDCKVIAFTGDNPASLAGMRAADGDIVISMGTSDTVFLWLHDIKPSLDGSIFINPLESDDYLGLLCFKNGSLTREKVRDDVAGSSWDTFSQMLQSTPRGNDGNIGIYFDVPEITPHAVGIYRFNEKDEKVESFSPATEVRALIEGQCLSRRMYTESLGYKLGSRGRILATGGAAANKAILQVVADVFNSPVYVQNVANSACLGCAYRAKHGMTQNIPFSQTMRNAPVELKDGALPSPDASQIYDGLVARYRKLENQVTSVQK